MATIILVTGSANSGKSAYAESRVRAIPGRPTYIGTARPRDEEMRARIAAQAERRGTDWTNVHAPLDLCRALRSTDGGGPRLVGNLTEWLSNVMLDRRDWFEAVRELETELGRQKSPLFLMTNEIGAGMPPNNSLQRRYREASGLMNQVVAQMADELVLIVAGHPMVIKAPGSPHA